MKNSNNLPNNEYIKITLDDEYNICKLIVTLRSDIYTNKAFGDIYTFYNNNLDEVHKHTLYASYYSSIPILLI